MQTWIQCNVLLMFVDHPKLVIEILPKRIISKLVLGQHSKSYWCVSLAASKFICCEVSSRPIRGPTFGRKWSSWNKIYRFSICFTWIKCVQDWIQPPKSQLWDPVQNYNTIPIEIVCQRSQNVLKSHTHRFSI